MLYMDAASEEREFKAVSRTMKWDSDLYVTGKCSPPPQNRSEVIERSWLREPSSVTIDSFLSRKLMGLFEPVNNYNDSEPMNVNTNHREALSLFFLVVQLSLELIFNLILIMAEEGLIFTKPMVTLLINHKTTRNAPKQYGLSKLQ